MFIWNINIEKNHNGNPYDNILKIIGKNNKIVINYENNLIHCINCKELFKEINENIYFFENFYINKLLEKYKIDTYLNKNIKDFLYPLNYIVYSEKKSRNKNIDWDPDNYFIYEIITTKLCFKCFLAGIDHCLSLNNNFIFRRDIFTLNENNINIKKTL